MCPGRHFPSKGPGRGVRPCMEIARSHPMLILRPIRDDDLPGLVALAQTIEGGLTTLPPDREFLQERIDASLHAFSPRVKRPGGEYYLFVLVDSTTDEVVGTAGIASRVG